MSDNNENLQENNEDASITASADGNTVDGAAAQAAEDTHTADPRDEIINQQNSTIEALMKRTEELTGQINKLLTMGVQINDGQQVTTEQTKQLNNSLADDYVPLKDLGAEIGKHSR